MNIKDLNLTDYDFKLLVDGLDALPSKSFPAELMGEMMIQMMPEGARDKARRELEQRNRDKDSKKEALKEDCVILQGKLLQFKRWLIEQDALKQTEDILKK